MLYAEIFTHTIDVFLLWPDITTFAIFFLIYISSLYEHYTYLNVNIYLHLWNFFVCDIVYMCNVCMCNVCICNAGIYHTCWFFQLLLKKHALTLSFSCMFLMLNVIWCLHVKLLTWCKFYHFWLLLIFGKCKHANKIAFMLGICNCCRTC